jgi:hypothetical protein
MAYDTDIYDLDSILSIICVLFSVMLSLGDVAGA